MKLIIIGVLIYFFIILFICIGGLILAFKESRECPKCRNKNRKKIGSEDIEEYDHMFTGGTYCGTTTTYLCVDCNHRWEETDKALRYDR